MQNGDTKLTQWRIIIKRLKLTFATERPPPYIAYQEYLMAAETVGEYFS